MNHKMQVAALLGATMLSTSVWAQEIDEVIVYSSPFEKAATDVISTTEILDAEAISGQASGPIGDVLSVLPGVSTAGFGPAVGQPVIRGLGGYRIDVMQNGMTIGDIAASSGDHANAVNIFDAQRVEVLKGPAALRYGAFAATGVVNTFNRHLDANAEDGSDLLIEFGNNADETVTAFYTRRDGFAVSAYLHDADAITIPTHAESEILHASEDHDEELEEGEQEGENTQHDMQGFSLSGRFGDDQTSLTVLLSSDEKDYGVPGHEEHAGDDDDGEASIEFSQQALQARLNYTPSSGMFNSLRADLVLTSLEQDELEGNEVGTAFEQDTLHVRGEATALLGDWKTLLGAEWRDNELEAEAGHHDDEGDAGGDATDEEHHAYLPSTESTQYGFFAFAERENNGWLSELAVRFDNVELEAKEAHHEEDGDEEEEEEEAYHHEGAQSFDLTNISAGLARKLDGNLLVGASISSTERAPSKVELYANGEHHAAGRTEFGLATSEAAIDKETSLSSELYIRKAWGKSQLRFAFFNNDYSDFIYLQSNDSHAECEEEPCYEFKQQDAELSGYEIDYSTALMMGGRMWDAALNYSTLSGDLSGGGDLPSLPGDKLGAAIATSFNAVTMKVNVEIVSDQEDTGAGELATDGFTNVDISASYQPPQYEGLSLTAAVRNVTDEEIRHHTSPLKDKMPNAGQDIRLTARYRF
jgi:iron complex outermembrane receptor protein